MYFGQEPTLHPETVAEVRRARYRMGAGAAIMAVGLFLPRWWMTGVAVGGGLTLWTQGMQRQTAAGVEGKIAAEGLTGIIARCVAHCIMAPRP